MAEASTKESRDYGKSTQKFFNRTLEKVMHTLGKSDKTSDEDFDVQAQRFNEQQAAALRLQKELKAYIVQSKAMTNATQSLYSAMKEVYEADWERSVEFKDEAEKLPAVQTTFLNELNDKVLTEMNSYAAQFLPVKEKIAKRRRKLVDYDVARHNVQSLETAKKRNDFKVTQAHTELRAAQTVYDSIHQDLQSELPRLYDSRVSSLCSCFDVLLTTELEFEDQCSTIKREMAKIASRMCTKETETGTSRRTSSRNSSGRQTNNYVNHEDLRPFQRLSTPDEISKQPVLTAVFSTNRNPSTQLSRESAAASVFGETDVEDIKFEQKRQTSSDYGQSNWNVQKQPVDAQNGAPQQMSYGSAESSTARSSGASLTGSPFNGAPKSFNGAAENGFGDSKSSAEKLGLSGSSNAWASRENISPSVQLHNAPGGQGQVQKSTEENWNQQLFSGKEEEDLFSEEMLKQRQQEDLLKQQRQQKQPESLLQQELEFENQALLTMKQQQINGSERSEPRDMATSFLNSPELATDFFAAKNSAKPKPKDVILYSVEGTNPYETDDADELNLQPGHVINVLEDDESLDEGWLLGFNTATGKRGLFPANFTKPLQ